MGEKRVGLGVDSGMTTGMYEGGSEEEEDNSYIASSEYSNDDSMYNETVSVSAKEGMGLNGNEEDSKTDTESEEDAINVDRRRYDFHNCKSEQAEGYFPQ